MLNLLSHLSTKPSVHISAQEDTRRREGSRRLKMPCCMRARNNCNCDFKVGLSHQIKIITYISICEGCKFHGCLGDSWSSEIARVERLPKTGCRLGLSSCHIVHVFPVRLVCCSCIWESHQLNQIFLWCVIHFSSARCLYLECVSDWNEYLPAPCSERSAHPWVTSTHHLIFHQPSVDK